MLVLSEDYLQIIFQNPFENHTESQLHLKTTRSPVQKKTRIKSAPKQSKTHKPSPAQHAVKLFHHQVQSFQTVQFVHFTRLQCCFASLSCNQDESRESSLSGPRPPLLGSVVGYGKLTKLGIGCDDFDLLVVPAQWEYFVSSLGKTLKHSQHPSCRRLHAR